LPGRPTGPAEAIHKCFLSAQEARAHFAWKNLWRQLHGEGCRATNTNPVLARQLLDSAHFWRQLNPSESINVNPHHKHTQDRMVAWDFTRPAGFNNRKCGRAAIVFKSVRDERANVRGKGRG
jgi:hypothetical protein